MKSKSLGKKNVLFMIVLQDIQENTMAYKPINKIIQTFVILKNLYFMYSNEEYFIKKIGDKNIKGYKKKMIFFCIIDEKRNKHDSKKYIKPFLFVFS